MSAWWSYAGAALLVAATLPQAARLLRMRRADEMTWGFVALNAAGITLLGLRSAQIGEWDFVVVNAFTAAFWATVALVKTSGTRWWPGARRARRAPGSPSEAA